MLHKVINIILLVTSSHHMLNSYRMALRLSTPEVHSPKTKENHMKNQWIFAVQKVKCLVDPWADLNMESLPEELVTRHMYNPRTRKWRNDEIVIKVQSTVSNMHM